MADILQGNLHGGTYKHYNEPVGDFGVWNGQFETGPGTSAEGWEFYPEAGATVQRQRTVGGCAGGWCAEGGQAGVGRGGTLLGLRYFCVDEYKDYYLAASFLADNAAATIYLGMRCYNSNKVLLGDVWGLSAIAPGTQAFVTRRLNIGPNGDETWWGAGGTRYARVLIRLQWNAALGNAHAYVDDVQFGQLKKTYSPLMRLVHEIASDAVERDFTAQAWILYPNSTMTITLEEPGFLWIFYRLLGHRNITAVRLYSHEFAVFIDGVLIPAPFFTAAQGSVAIGHYAPLCLAGPSVVQTRGVHTVDLCVFVVNAGDTIRCQFLSGAVFYVRAY